MNMSNRRFVTNIQAAECTYCGYPPGRRLLLARCTTLTTTGRRL